MQPSPELQDLTSRIAEAVGDGDVAFLGTDPDEWWTDLAGLERALAAQRGAGVMVIPGDPLAYQEGNVGWAIDRTVRFRIGDQEAPFRFSVVYRHEDGEWKMVHFHSSVGVSNEEDRGVTLPEYPPGCR